MIITVGLLGTQTETSANSWKTQQTVQQVAVRSLTHHRVGRHRHSGSVGEVEEDFGRFGHEVAAGRTLVLSYWVMGLLVLVG